MQQQYTSLYNEKRKNDDRLTKLWTEVKDIRVQLSSHVQKLKRLKNRLCDSNQSLTGPAISQIAGGIRNSSLQTDLLIMALERNKIQMGIQAERSIVDNFTNRYKTVLKDHEKICRESNIIDQKIYHIVNQISHDMRKKWNDEIE